MTGKGCKDLTKLEKGILELLQKHMAKIGFFTLLFFSMLLRWVLLPYGSNDFLDFLRPWYEEIRASGGMTALKNEIGDYNYLYRFLLAVFSYIPNPMIAVKLLSLLFDYIGAAGGAFLVWTLLADSPSVPLSSRRFYVGATAIALLFCPTVLLNAAVWAQCDFMYVSCLLFCLAFFWRERYFSAFIWYGLAFSFKLQAVFLLPVLFLLYIHRKNFSVLYFLLIPGTLLATGFPVILARWTVVGPAALLEPFQVYFSQTGTYRILTLNMPNVYSFLSGMEYQINIHIADIYNYCRLAGILFTLALLGGAVLFFLVKNWDLDAKGYLLFSIFSVYTCIMFLPSMHERYGFCATILLLLYYILYRELGKWILTYLFVECSVYVAVLTELSLLPGFNILAYINLAVYARFAIEMYRHFSSTTFQKGKALYKSMVGSHQHPSGRMKQYGSHSK